MLKSPRFFINRLFAQSEVFFVRKETPVDEDRTKMNRRLRKIMGEDCAIEWREVDEIPKTPHGKFMQIRSLVHSSEEN